MHRISHGTICILKQVGQRKITAIKFENLIIYKQPQNSHLIAREITTIQFANLTISVSAHYIPAEVIFRRTPYKIYLVFYQDCQPHNLYNILDTLHEVNNE